MKTHLWSLLLLLLLASLLPFAALAEDVHVLDATADLPAMAQGEKQTVKQPFSRIISP